MACPHPLHHTYLPSYHQYKELIQNTYLNLKHQCPPDSDTICEGGGDLWVSMSVLRWRQVGEGSYVMRQSCDCELVTYSIFLPPWQMPRTSRRT